MPKRTFSKTDEGRINWKAKKLLSTLLKTLQGQKWNEMPSQLRQAQKTTLNFR